MCADGGRKDRTERTRWLCNYNFLRGFDSKLNQYPEFQNRIITVQAPKSILYDNRKSSWFQNFSMERLNPRRFCVKTFQEACSPPGGRVVQVHLRRTFHTKSPVQHRHDQFPPMPTTRQTSPYDSDTTGMTDKHPYLLALPIRVSNTPRSSSRTLEPVAASWE